MVAIDASVDARPRLADRAHVSVLRVDVIGGIVLQPFLVEAKRGHFKLIYF
jgi:hypothetical protein